MKRYDVTSREKIPAAHGKYCIYAEVEEEIDIHKLCIKGLEQSIDFLEKDNTRFEEENERLRKQVPELEIENSGRLCVIDALQKSNNDTRKQIIDLQERLSEAEARLKTIRRCYEEWKHLDGQDNRLCPIGGCFGRPSSGPQEGRMNDSEKRAYEFEAMICDVGNGWRGGNEQS